MEFERHFQQKLHVELELLTNLSHRRKRNSEKSFDKAGNGTIPHLELLRCRSTLPSRKMGDAEIR